MHSYHLELNYTERYYFFIWIIIRVVFKFKQNRPLLEHKFMWMLFNCTHDGRGMTSFISLLIALKFMSKHTNTHNPTTTQCNRMVRIFHGCCVFLFKFRCCFTFLKDYGLWGQGALWLSCNSNAFFFFFFFTTKMHITADDTAYCKS